jgi:hypothetical protein
MPALPQELFFILIFSAVLLVQFLYKQLVKRPEWMQPPGTLEDSVDAAQPAPAPAPSRTLSHPRSAERPKAPSPAPVPTPAPPTAHRAGWRPRRFSRTSLMPDRRAVQDAVVVAALLGPCHALRKHGPE